MRRPIAIAAGVSALAALSSCRRPVPPATQVPKPPVKIWAHRGCCYAWPENTLDAFRAACELDGLTGIELDIQLTKDGKIVVIHDETVDRTTDGKGNVRDFTLAELKELKIKTHSKNLIPQYTQIPTIEEVFDLVKPYCLRYGLKINIELKNSVVRYEGMEEMILALVRQYELEPYIVYSSFNPDSLVLIKQKKPDALVGILNSSIKECLAFAEAHETDALHPNYRGRDVENIREKTSLPIRMWNFPPDVPFYPNKGSFAVPDFREICGYGITDVFSNIPEVYLKKRTQNQPVSSTNADKPGLSFSLCAEISRKTGIYKKCSTNRMADFHFYEVNAGDFFEFDAKGYEYQIAFYNDTIDDRYIHTYCYSEEENWSSYTKSIKRFGWKNHGQKFKRHGWARILVRKKESVFKRGFSVLKLTERFILTADDKAFVEGHCRFMRKPAAYGIKPFFDSEIDDTAKKVNALRDKWGEDTLVLALLADTHYVINGRWDDTAHNLLGVHEKAPFDALIHLGDFTDGKTPARITEEYFNIQNDGMKKLGIPLYYTLGNHDSNYFQGNTDLLNVTEQSRLYLGRGEPHYYVDFEDKGLRLLFLHSFDHTQEGQNNRYGFSGEEIEWTRRALAGTPAGWKVIVFSHVPLLASMHYWSDKIRGEQEMVSLLGEFDRSGGSSAGGRVLAFIHGHTHSDCVNRDLPFPVASIGCAKIEDEQVHKASGSVTWPREPGTVSQELWDVLVVDADSGSLDFVRFGAGEDRHLDRGGR
ncbi:MAG: metallophosphoesterase [Treponema sp.]|nr:metallophosphoesterase [Treponema sp.]